jgi:hypothetical protein
MKGIGLEILSARVFARMSATTAAVKRMIPKFSPRLHGPLWRARRSPVRRRSTNLPEAARPDQLAAGAPG